MALTLETLRSELEAFAEQTLQNQFHRLESRLLQGIQNEIQNLNFAGPPSMPPGPKRRPPAPPWQGKPATLALPHAMPPDHMNVEDLENEFRYIGKWAESVERDEGDLPQPAPARSPRPLSKDRSPRPGAQRSRSPIEEVEEIQAPKLEKQNTGKTKAKGRRIQEPGPPPDDRESIEPLRTYVMATEMSEIDKAQSQEKSQNLVRAFASTKKSVGGLTRTKTLPNIFSNSKDDRSKTQDESKKKLQAAGRATTRDRLSTGSVDSTAPEDTPVEAFVVQNQDEAQVQRESTELVKHDSFILETPQQQLIGDDELNGHLDHQFSFHDHEDALCTKFYNCISLIVKHPFFDYTSALFIFLNSISIGMQTEWSAENFMESVPDSYRIVDVCFCCVFTLELVMRIYVFRTGFFWCSDWKWNFFDALLVGMQLTEEILNVFASQTKALNFSFMRVLRILRLVRIVRLFRVLRVITELRTIVSSIAGCMKSLFSTLVLLILMIYVVGVFFTQLVSDHYSQEGRRVKDLDLYYGSLSRSILSLYQAMSGGLDWENMVNPLIDNISPALAAVFSLYVAFAVLAMMNVVTGVFVESALLSAKEDKDIYMVNHMRALLKSTDVDSSGTITWDEFKAQLNNPQMVELFRSIDVDIKEARGLFDLLDMNDLGKITTDQFVTGCLRLRGHAKSLDLSLLIHEQRRISKRTFTHIRYVQSQLTYLCETIGYVDPCTSSPLLKVAHEFEV